MAYTQDDILLAIKSAESRGDSEKANRIRARYGVADPAAGAGLVSGIKGGLANLAAGIARPIEDIAGQPTALGKYADEVRGALPQAYTGIESIAERPVAVVGELVGQQVPQLGATVGGAKVGEVVGGALGGLIGKSPGAVQLGRRLGAAGGAYLPNLGMQYDEVRGRQEQTGKGTIPEAIAAAATGAALDTAFGLESLANRLVLGGARDAARSRLKNAAIQAATQPLIEAPTEAAQAALARLAAGQDLSSPEAVKEYIDNAAAAALVSAPIGGALGAIQRPTAPVVTPEQTPPADTGEPEFEVPPAEALLETPDDYAQPEPEAVQPAPEAQPAPAAAPEVSSEVAPPSAPEADLPDIGEGPGRSLANIVPSPEGDFELEGAIPRDESPTPEQFRPAVAAIDAQIEAAKSPVQRAKLIDTRNSFVDAILARQRPKPDPKELMLRDVASRPAVTPEQAQRRNASPPPKAKFQRAIPHPKVPGKFVFVTPEEADVLAPSAPKADLVPPAAAPDLLTPPAVEAEPVTPAVAETPEIPNAPVQRQEPEVRQQERPPVDEGRKEPEAGSGDLFVSGGEVQAEAQVKPKRRPPPRPKKVQSAEDVRQEIRRQALSYMDRVGIKLDELPDTMGEKAGGKFGGYAKRVFRKGGVDLYEFRANFPEFFRENSPDAPDPVDPQEIRNVIRGLLNNDPSVIPNRGPLFEKWSAANERDQIRDDAIEQEKKQYADQDRAARHIKIQSDAEAVLAPEEIEAISVANDGNDDAYYDALERATNERADEYLQEADRGIGEASPVEDGEPAGPREAPDLTEADLPPERVTLQARGQGDMFGGPFAGGRAPERALPASERPENFRLVAQTRTDKQTDEELVRTAKAVQATLFQNRPEDVVAAVDKARKRLEKDIGKRAVANLEAQGTLLLVDSSEVPADLKKTMDAKTFAIFDADSATAYVMVDRVPDDRLKAIVTHEIGEHYALPGLLGGAGYGNMIQEVRRLIGSSTDAKFVAAVKHVRENYDLAETDINFAREVVARYAENPGGMEWWNRVVGTVREFLRGLGVTVEMSEKDVAFLVGKALRAAGRGEIRYIQPEGEFSTPNAEARAEITESKAFKDWFGDSKVVDENGEPLVVYHGTSGDFSEFAGGITQWASTDPSLASAYADHRSKDAPARILPLYMRAEKPFDSTKMAKTLSVGAFFSEARKQAVDAGRTVDDAKARELLKRVKDSAPAFTFQRFELWNNTEQRFGADGSSAIKELLELLGFDSILDMERGIKTFGVFRPEQIKSAIGNRGAFNPNSPNILEARGPQSPLPDQGTKDALFGLLSRRSIAAKFVNRMNRWPEGQAYIEKQMGGKLRWDENVAAEAKRVPGKIKAAVEQFESTFVDPIVDGLRKAKLTLEQLDEYAKLRHAKERNEAIAKINPDMPDGGSGITTADAATRMTALLNSLTPAQRTALERAGDLLVKMNARRLKMQLDAGLVTQAEYDVLTKKYQHYVPLKSVKDEDDDVDSAGVGGYVVRGGEYKRALGRFSEADSPLTVSIMDYERAILRSEKKVPSDALWKLANNPNAKDLVEVFDPKNAPPEFQVQKPRQVAVRDPKTGKAMRVPKKDANGKIIMQNGKPVMQYVTKTEVVIGVDPNWSGSKNLIPVKVDGQTQYVLVKDDVMAAQFKNMDEQRLGDALELFNKTTSLFGRMLTQFNPAFIPVNFFRDAFAVTFNSMSVPGVSAQKVMRGIWPGIAAIRAERTGQPHPLAKEYREFIDDGASIGGLGLETYLETMNRIEEKGLSIKDANKTTARQALGAVKRFGERVAKVNEAIENSTRFSVYRHAKAVFEQNNLLMGMSPQDANADARQRAANLAREISVDFNQRGEYSRMLNTFFVFFNAAVQGLASFHKFVAKRTPENRRAQMGLAVLGMAGIAARLVNAMIGDDDELEEEKALAFESKAGINIPIAIGDAVVTLPLQYIYNIPFVAGYRMTDAFLTGRFATNIGQILKSSFGALSPLGEPKVDSKTPVSFVAKTFTPTLFTPFLDIMDNTNSFGGPVAKEVGLFDKAPPPKAYDHWKSASELSVGISKLLNAISGGDQYRPGAIDVAPEWLDYLASYYGGGPFRTIAQIGATAHALTDENEPLQLSKLPIVSRVITDQKPEWYVSKRYYDLAKDMAYVDAALKDRQQVAPEDRRALPAFQDAEKLLRNLNKLRREAAAKNDATRERDYEMRIEDVQARAVRAYNLAHKDWETSFKGATPEELSGLARQQGKSKLADLLESVREP